MLLNLFTIFSDGAHDACTALSQHSHCAYGVLNSKNNDSCAHPLSSYCAAMATLRQSYAFRTPWQRRAKTFVLSMFKVRTVVRRSMHSHGVYWRRHCIAAEILAIAQRAHRRSAFFLEAVGSPWERCSGVTGVLRRPLVYKRIAR